VKINVSKIPEGGMNLRFERDGKWFRELLPKEKPGEFTLERINVACSAKRVKETVFIEGTAATTVEAPCSRCLEPTRLPIASSFKYTYCPSTSLSQEEVELRAEDLDYAYYEEDTIDLDNLIFEQIMLQIPIKPLCAETCKGLCPHCGINLNVASCGCQNERFDERLAALKQFKVRSENP